MGLLDFFKRAPSARKYDRVRELGGYAASFSPFGSDIYKSAVVRSCIRPLAEHTSKANAVCPRDPMLARILNVQPNQYMTGKDFLAKIRTRLELTNTAFVYIERDDKGHASAFYPVPTSTFEAVEYAGRLYIDFRFPSGEERVLPWADLAVLRKDYNQSDIAGDDNNSILKTLEMLQTSDQGTANAIRATANLRGILKSTKAMLAPEAVKEQKEQFVRDYLNLENEGGIASLDASQEFTPITMSPVIASWEVRREFREDVQRYYGVSDAIIRSDYTEEQLEAFYNARIEPFLVALGLELTKKVFTDRERGYGNEILYESNRIQYASNKTKLAMVALVDRGALTPNEWRAIFNLAPVEGGDEPIRRLDTDTVKNPQNEGDEEDDQ